MLLKYNFKIFKKCLLTKEMKKKIQNKKYLNLLMFFLKNLCTDKT